MSPRSFRYRIGFLRRLILQLSEYDHRLGGVAWRDARPEDVMTAQAVSAGLLMSAAAALLEPESLHPQDRLRLAADLEAAAGAQP